MSSAIKNTANVNVHLVGSPTKKGEVEMIEGHNNDVLHEHSLDHHLEFFSKAGSLFSTGSSGRKACPAYGGNAATTSALALFKAMWIIPFTAARQVAFKLLLWLRNPRGGAGNRSGFRECLTWLATEAPGGAEWLGANIELVREYGRCDDWKALFGTPLEQLAADTWAEYIRKKDYYALKWAKRDMVPLQRAFKTNEAGLRKLLREYGRKSTEQHMCNNLSDCESCGKVTHWMHCRVDGVVVENAYFCENCKAHRDGPITWKTIDYSHVESKCMASSNKAFLLHDPQGFAAYKDALIKGETDIKASVLFPHDCLRSALSGDPDIADAQFAALPNYMEESGERIMAICDTSGSMASAVAGGSLTCLDVSKALGLYCSDKLGITNPFYRMYMEFSSEPVLINWRGKKFHDQASKHTGDIASTNIQKTLDFLLDMAMLFGVTPDKMISTILLLSDMQFDKHVSADGIPAGMPTFGGGAGCTGTEATVVDKCMKRWEEAGYTRPKILYWNLAGYAGQPATVQTPNTGLVSGFSPSILKAVLSGEDFTPLAIMQRVVDQYDITTPDERRTA